MSNQKLKQENYTSFGGMNSKFSPYCTSPMEFLYLENFDFQTPGALTQRWGSTMYVGQTWPNRITSVSEFERLNGFSQIIVGTSAGMWAGATTGVAQGFSFTTLSNPTGASVNFTPYALAHAAPFISNGFYYQGLINQRVNYNMFQYGLTTMPPIKYVTNQVYGEYQSIAYLVDNCFIADGNKFVKYNGITCTPVGLPMPVATGITATASTGLTGSQIGFGVPGSSYAQALFYVSYVNNRGFESRVTPILSLSTGNIAGSSYSANYISVTMGIYTPPELGISSINVYGYIPGLTYTLSLGITVIIDQMSTLNTWTFPYMFLGNYAASGSTVSYIPIGSTIGGIGQFSESNLPLASQIHNTYVPLGETLMQGYGSIFFYNDTRYIPRFLENYQNRLFCAGFSATPSTVWFSDIAEPEGYTPDANFEVRTNDSDVITCMRAYQTRLYIFKINSFHSLFGDNPNNFYLQEISNIYGCLNDRSALIFQNTLIFLDRKGLMQFDGSQLSCLSTKVQHFFDNMNYDAALQNAIMVHDKMRNQIMLAIPSDEFPLDAQKNNNLVLVYDYVASSWTTHRGYNPTCFGVLKGRNNTHNVFYGNSSGMVSWQGPSFLADNGVGYTLKMETRFIHDLGDSTQKQYRRLYLNSNFSGNTLVFNADFLQDYGSSVVLSTTITLNAFQNRIDFGISCKSIAFILYSSDMKTSPLALYGFTLESRLQRRV